MGVLLLLLLVLALAVLLPRVGLLARLPAWRAAQRRAEDENALKHLLQQRQQGQPASFASLAGALRLADRRIEGILRRLEARRLAQTRGQAFELTPEGERIATQIVRAHRLWERYLADEARLPLERVHTAAERREHELTPDEVDRLDARLGHPTVDPHGDPIPTPDGALAGPPGTPLSSWPAGVPGRIVHLEDEPTVVYARLVGEGLRVGQVVRVVEAAPERITLTDGEREFHVAPVLAANVFLVPVAEAGAAAREAARLSELPVGATAEIVALAPECRGYTRRRLLDLGFTPGTRLSPVLDTFAGDPRAYRVRGTTVALRREQADHILVRRIA